MELDFHELEFFFFNCEKSISHVQHTIFISAECPFHTLGLQVAIFQYRSLGLQRSIGQQNRCNYKLQKKTKKNNNPTIKTNFGTCIIDQFYLLIS